MIIDWAIGAIQQVPTAEGRGVWNWSGVSAAVVAVTVPLSPTIRRASRSADDQLGRAVDSDSDPIRKSPAATPTVVRRAPN